MVAIPKPIKKVFESFPLYTFEAPCASNEADRIFEGAQTFYFDGPVSNSSFLLGVHNIVEVSGKFIPSDPISFGTALILADKNSLKFPQNGLTSKSSHGLIKVSYQASPDLHLPILIEDLGDARSMRTSHLIERDISLKNFNENREVSIVNDLIDTSFTDIWTLALLCEDLPMETFSQIFDLDPSEPNVLNQLVKYELIEDISTWRHFKIRHPYLFDHSLIQRNTKLDAFYKTSLKAFDKLLQLLVSQAKDGKLHRLIQLKIVAYILLIDKFFTNTRLGNAIEGYKDFTSQCYEIFDEF